MTSSRLPISSVPLTDGYGGRTLKCIVPTTRSPLFTANGSGNSNLACLSISIYLDHGKETYCQCVRIAVYQYAAQ
jgi:hypothetical protein